VKFLSTIIVLFAVLLVIAAPLSAQDTGIKDTLRFVPISSTWTINTEADSLFTVEIWGWSDQTISALSLPFVMSTSTGGGTGHDDSLVVTKDWTAAITTQVSTFAYSHIDGTSFPDALHNDYNGWLLGILNIFPATEVFPANTPTKIGDLTVTMLDPANSSCEFDLVIDSLFFPPAGVFKFSPADGSGFPPEFIGATIHVVNNLCSAPADPTIGVDPASFDFEAVENGPNPASQVLHISNVGDGTLNWSVSNAEGWLSLNPTSGVDTDSTMLSVDIAGLSAGAYEDTVTVSDPTATNNPVKVPVALTVLEPPPVIVLDPTSFMLETVLGETITDIDSLFITNGGGRTLNWTASDNVDWLTLGTTSGSGDGIVEFVVNISSLDSAGTYLATITVSDPEATNNPQTASVTLVATEPPPVIVLDSTEFTFDAIEGGPNPASQALSISNGVPGTLHWTASDDADWLTLSPTSGEGDGMTTLSIDITGLVAGPYSATITVSDPDAVNNPQTALVTLNVAEVSGDLAAVFDPDPAYIYYKFAIDSIMATVFIGNFSDHAPGDVVETSILVNGTVEARSTVVTTHPDFVGPVLAVTIAIGPFLDIYGPLLDTTANDFTVEGIYEDSLPFSAIGTLDIIGKYSNNPKQYIVPDDFIALPGDIDQSGGIDIDDIIMTVGYIFLGRPLPGSIVKADYDCSHSVDIDDVIRLAEYVFLGGELPCVP